MLKRTRRVGWLAALLSLQTAVAQAGGQAPSGNAGWSDVRVPGGVAALAHALDFSPAPDAERFLPELARRLYAAPKGKHQATDARLTRLAQILGAVERLDASLAKLQPPAGRVSLALAANRQSRSRLEDLLELVGCKLSRRSDRYLVERSNARDAAARVQLLADLGLDLRDLATRLNAGEEIRLEVPGEMIPLPLPPRVWNEAVFDGTAPPDRLFAAIATDRRAALAAYGFAALDEPTLRHLAASPGIVTALIQRHAGAVAAFGRSLRVRDGRVVVPGGAQAQALFEVLVGEPVSDPARFIDELLGRDDSRLAWFYDSIAQLDPARQRFALGLWLPASSRTDRFHALYATFAGAYRTEWQPSERPFMRLAADAAWLLVETRVDPSGTPHGPAWRLLWERAFESLDIPDDPRDMLKGLGASRPIDAAELVELVSQPLRAGRMERLAAFTFGQRVFGGATAAQAPDVLVALRGHQRFPMLTASLERLGATVPALYSAAVRHAARLQNLDPSRAAIALREFQGALALIVQVRATRAIDRQSAERVARALVDIPLADGRYEGRVAAWLTDVFLPAVAPNRSAATDSIEDAVLAALAGLETTAEAGRPRPVMWEGRAYRADIVTTEFERLRRLRERQGGVSLDTAIALAGLARRLAAGPSSLESLRDLTKEVRALSERLRSLGPRVLPTADGWPDATATMERALKELTSITKPKHLDRAPDEAARLVELSDALVADVLGSITYALALRDPEERAIVGPNLARRHDFGFDRSEGPSRASAAWRLPQAVVLPGEPWHASGSLLGLDVGLASYSLRRIGFDGELRPPVLNANDRRAFAESVALMDPFDLTDADRDAIARAIRGGRARVSAASGDEVALQALATEAGMDAWRMQQVRWVARRQPSRLMEFFAISELFRLGTVPTSVNLDAWGSSAVWANGCLCTRLPAIPDWPSCTGRSELGLLGSRTADLTLRVVELMADLRLPAALTRSVLAIATQEFVDRVIPADPDDWLVLARSAAALTREQIEDYTAALTGDGPLMPDAGAGVQVRR